MTDGPYHRYRDGEDDAGYPPPPYYPPAQSSPPQWGAAGYPPDGQPPAGYPASNQPPAAYPPSNQPPAGYPPAGYPPTGYPPPSHAPTSAVPASYPPAGHAPTSWGGYPSQAPADDWPADWEISPPAVPSVSSAPTPVVYPRSTSAAAARRRAGNSPRRHHRSGRWVPAVAAVVALAVVAGGVIIWQLGDRPTGGAQAAACGERADLRLAVAPEFAPVLEQAANDLGGGPDGCPRVVVTAETPADTIAGLGSVQAEGWGWVPSSRHWLSFVSAPRPPGGAGPAPSGPAAPGADAPAAQGLFAGELTSLARTPVVLAAPRPFAESVGWPARPVSWADLGRRAGGGQLPRLSMGNPQRDVAALLTVLGIHAAMGRAIPDPGIAQLGALTVRSRLADAEADPTALLSRMAAQSDPAAALREVGLFPVTEQALWTHQQQQPAVSLAGLYPADGLAEADYPLVLSRQAAADEATRNLAARLVERVRSAQFTQTLLERGFRPAAAPAAGASAAPGGSSAAPAAPSADGLLARYPAPAALPADPAAVARLTTQWAKYRRLKFQVLVLVDGSGSMNDPIRTRSGRATTKAGLLREAGAQATQLFGLDTSVGMWLFASPAPDPAIPPLREVVPLGPLDQRLGTGSRRQALAQAVSRYQAQPTAGTPLYESVLRATDAMRRRVAQGTVTLVVVLTDGKDEDSPYAMSRQQFMTRLAAGRDPARPVPVFGIGYGSGADQSVLNEMARVTGGQAAASNDPADLANSMARIFLAAHAAA